MKRAYGEDLAYIHDTAFGGFAREAAPWLLRRLRAAGFRCGRVVDLGCGGGQWAKAACDAGYDVLGVDLSGALIRRARKRAPKATFRVASLLSVPLPECVAVTALGECLNYCFDRNDRGSLQRLFRRICNSLPPGGLFTFDVAEPGLVADGDERRWIEGKDWAILLAVRERGQTATRTMGIFRRVGGSYRRSRETHVLRLYDRATVQGMLESVGFSVRLLQSYGKTKMLPGRAGFEARKQ